MQISNRSSVAKNNLVIMNVNKERYGAMMNIMGWMGPCLALTLSLAMCASSHVASAAVGEASVWEVEIDVFSGRPNPVFKLQDSEVGRVKELLSHTSSVAAEKATEKEKAKAFPSVLGYRGLRIRQVGKNKAVQSETRLRGKNMLVGSGKDRSWRSAEDASLEQFLVDLAFEKGAIPKQVHEHIRNEIKKGAHS